MDYKDIGMRIRTVRKSCKMTQEQLAEAVGVGVTHISHIETAFSEGFRLLSAGLSFELQEG